MCPHPASVPFVLTIGLALLLAGLAVDPASAEAVPFNCMILPGEEIASILMTNSLGVDASCIICAPAR
jgi:hypothetical protein